MIFLSTLLLSVFITLAFIPIFMRVAGRAHVLDMPEPRKVHSVPIPRCGGIAMSLGAVGPIIFWVQPSPTLTAFLAGGGIVVAAGLLDDFRGLGYQAKFMAQILAAMMLVLYGGVVIRNLGNFLPDGAVLPDWLANILTVFFVVGVTNAINLSDGLDGLAGGICLLIFLFMSYLAYIVGNMTVAIIGLSISGTLLGFLRFNTYPAIVFMGDAGSMLLGFSAAALSIMLTQGSTPLSPILPLILLGFPILDTLAVMAQRISEGRSPFAADKKHFHHRLIRLGLYPTEAVFSIYVIQCLMILFAWFFRFHSEQLLLLSYGVFAVSIVALFTVADRAGWRLRRFDLVDRIIKGRLKTLREKKIAIRVSFRVLYLGLPLFFVFQGFIPNSIPAYLSQLSAAVAAALALVWLFRKEWLGRVFMPCLYIFIPLLAYCGECDEAGWLTARLHTVHNLFYVALAFLAVATLKLTRRKGGFRITPMDFLVVVLALAIMVLPREILREEEMKIAIPKILALFFGFEVLIGELRGDISKVAATTIAGLAVVAGRGLLGI